MQKLDMYLAADDANRVLLLVPVFVLNERSLCRSFPPPALIVESEGISDLYSFLRAILNEK